MKSINRPIKPILSLKEITPSAIANPSIKTDKAKGSRFKRSVLEDLLRYKQDTPNMRAIFEILDPIAVPKAIFSFPLITAEIATNISGAEVPAAIRVSPITKSPTPKCFAITDE
tara:strand:+ start:2127 stop:2468 length:342 start_codon:yes stop_codon:yes gene_type:complete